jgi:hypothetical protein
MIIEVSPFWQFALSLMCLSGLERHQQNCKKLFALLGLLAAFPVADKSKQVHSTTNLETVKSHDSPHLIYDFPISLRH